MADRVDPDKAHHDHNRHQEPLWQGQKPREQAHHGNVQHQEHHIRQIERRNKTPDQIGLPFKQERSGLNIERHQKRQHHRCGATAGHPKRQHWDQCAARGCVIARFGGCDPAWVTGAKSAMLVTDLLFCAVRNKSTKRCSGTRQHPADKADHCPTDRRGKAFEHFSELG